MYNSFEKKTKVSVFNFKTLVPGAPLDSLLRLGHGKVPPINDLFTKMFKNVACVTKVPS